jgi:uncharacterized protein (DUF488 family)
MQRLLCTIGFTGKTAEEFFGLLLQAGVEKLIDIRQNRGGQLSGFAKHPDLAYFLREVAKIDYSHEPLLAPPAELLKEYRRARDWPAYETVFLTLMKQRGVPEKLDLGSWPSKVALLCSEPGPEKCHRRLVADLLVAHWSDRGELAEICHLVSEPKKPVKARRKKSVVAP